MADMRQVPHMLFLLFRAWAFSLLFINVLWMLISPKAWACLPWWLQIPGRGSVMSTKHMEQFANFWGGVVTRLVGGVGIFWMLYSLLKMGRFSN